MQKDTMEKKNIHILYFNTRDEMIRVDLRKVSYFKADRNYTDVFFSNGIHLTLPVNLISIEHTLDNDRMKGNTTPFVRLGRSLIVNLSHILHINMLRQELVMSDLVSPTISKVEVSKEALRKLKELYTNKTVQEQ